MHTAAVRLMEELGVDHVADQKKRIVMQLDLLRYDVGEPLRNRVPSRCQRIPTNISPNSGTCSPQMAGSVTRASRGGGPILKRGFSARKQEAERRRRARLARKELRRAGKRGVGQAPVATVRWAGG
jgi:hypothetical protein